MIKYDKEQRHLEQCVQVMCIALSLILVNYLMFAPCIIRRSRNNQHHAQICTTALFYILAPKCFGSSLPSSGNFWIRLSDMKIQIDLVLSYNVG
jgi:hypothetical protein